jgi:hypothetical protein
VEPVKIRLQLEVAGHKFRCPDSNHHHWPKDMARDILRKEGLHGIYRGLTVTALRDASAHGVYSVITPVSGSLGTIIARAFPNLRQPCNLCPIPSITRVATVQPLPAFARVAPS